MRTHCMNRVYLAVGIGVLLAFGSFAACSAAKHSYHALPMSSSMNSLLAVPVQESGQQENNAEILTGDETAKSPPSQITDATPESSLPTADMLVRKRFVTVDHGSFSFGVLATLTDQERQILMPYDTERLARECADALWADTDPLTVLRVFIACTIDERIQSRFAARCLTLWPALSYQFMGFYHDDPERHMSWCGRVGKDIQAIVSGDPSWRWDLVLNAAVTAAFWSGEDPELRLRSFWSTLVGRELSLEECQVMRRSETAGRIFMDMLVGKPEVYRPKFLLEVVPLFAEEVLLCWWEKIKFTVAADQGYLPFLYLGVLAGEFDASQPSDGILLDETFRQWKEIAEGTVIRDLDERRGVHHAENE